MERFLNKTREFELFSSHNSNITMGMIVML